MKVYQSEYEDYIVQQSKCFPSSPLYASPKSLCAEREESQVRALVDCKRRREAYFTHYCKCQSQNPRAGNGKLILFHEGNYTKATVKSREIQLHRRKPNFNSQAFNNTLLSRLICLSFPPSLPPSPFACVYAQMGHLRTSYLTVFPLKVPYKCIFSHLFHSLFCPCIAPEIL